MRPIVVLVVGAWLLGGCAVGVEHDYATNVPEIDASTSNSVAVGVADEREYVKSGSKKPDFVGISRGGFGNPFDVTTLSGNSLAQDWVDTILAALAHKGIPAEGEALTDGAKVDLLLRKGRDRALLVVLREWKADTYQNVGLSYDVDVHVYDSTGIIRGSSEIRGKDNLGGSAWNPPAYSREAVPKAFVKKVEELLNDRRIREGLQ